MHTEYVYSIAFQYIFFHSSKSTNVAHVMFAFHVTVRQKGRQGIQPSIKQTDRLFCCYKLSINFATPKGTLECLSIEECAFELY